MSTVERPDLLKVLFIDSAGAITCYLTCPDAAFLYANPDRAVTLPEFHEALGEHWKRHHPQLAVTLGHGYGPNQWHGQHCDRGRPRCAHRIPMDDHPDLCCTCKRPFDTPVCDPGRIVDPLNLGGR